MRVKSLQTAIVMTTEKLTWHLITNTDCNDISHFAYQILSIKFDNLLKIKCLRPKIHTIRFMRPCFTYVYQKSRISVVWCDKLQKKMHRMPRHIFLLKQLVEKVINFLNLGMTN